VDGDKHRKIISRRFGSSTFGELGVAGFFLISGFLLLQSWDRSRNIRVYLINRLRRLLTEKRFSPERTRSGSSSIMPVLGLSSLSTT
jgi:hypothetical protein